MALYAFDGTWNEAKDGEDPTYTNTNVVRFHQAYHAHSNTDDFYLKGVGTRFDLKAIVKKNGTEVSSGTLLGVLSLLHQEDG